MKRIITLFLLVLFCTAFSATEKENEKESSLNLELSTETRTLRVGQSTTIELKIIGQAIAEITKDTEGIDSSYLTTKPEFVHRFFYKPQKAGDVILGPYTLSFNGANLVSNSLMIKVLPEWDGSFSTLFRVDRNEIYLGESFELLMETWSKERKKFNISPVQNRELASIESRQSMSTSNTTNGKETHYYMKSWVITPKSKGEFLITKELFREFPNDVKPPQLKVQVK